MIFLYASPYSSQTPFIVTALYHASFYRVLTNNDFNHRIAANIAISHVMCQMLNSEFMVVTWWARERMRMRDMNPVVTCNRCTLRYYYIPISFDNMVRQCMVFMDIRLKTIVYFMCCKWCESLRHIFVYAYLVWNFQLGIYYIVNRFMMFQWTYVELIMLARLVMEWV